MKQLMFNHRLPQGGVFRPQESASVKVVGCVVAMFIICYAVNIYHNVCLLGLCKVPDAFREHKIALLLKVLNSAANPIAYAFFKKDIKKELKRFLSLAFNRASVRPL